MVSLYVAQIVRKGDGAYAVTLVERDTSAARTFDFLVEGDEIKVVNGSNEFVSYLRHRTFIAGPIYAAVLAMHNAEVEAPWSNDE